MRKLLILTLAFASNISFATENYTPVATGTLTSMRKAFDSAKKMSLADLKSYSEKLSCIRYDMNLKNEFTQTAVANIQLSEKSADLKFENDINTFTLVEKGSDLQALNTVLLFDNKIDMFLTVRKTENGELLLRTAVFQTKPAKTEFTEGIIYKCN